MRRIAEQVGRDGFTLLGLLEAPDVPAELRASPMIGVLRRVWERHFRRHGDPPGSGGRVELRAEGDLPPAAEGIESPYDPEARYRSKSGMHWTGYAVHLTETCDEDRPNLITHVATTTAAVHEVNCTAPIQEALAAWAGAGEHLVDAGFVTAELLVSSRDERAIRLIGPPRKDASWQNRTEGAYGVEDFAIDWEGRQVRCPQGRISASWKEYTEPGRPPYVSVRFGDSDCRACPARSSCTRAAKQGRALRLPLREQYEALRAMRSFIASEEGRAAVRQAGGDRGDDLAGSRDRSACGGRGTGARRRRTCSTWRRRWR